MAKSKNPPAGGKQDNKHQAASPEETRRELENQIKRALADYQNLERRVAEERRLLSRLSSILIIEKFLPVLDNLESAQSHLNDQGLALVIKQFKDVLQSEDVEEIVAEVEDLEQGRRGAQFDPNLHEATEVVKGENDNSIVKVLAKGYKMEDRVIRPAKVIVSKKSEANSDTISAEAGIQNKSDQIEEGGEGITN